MLANRKVLADFAEADHELIHHGKDFYYVASTAVSFGGTEYRLYAISPVTDLLVRYIIGGVAILLAAISITVLYVQSTNAVVEMKTVKKSISRLIMLQNQVQVWILLLRLICDVWCNKRYLSSIVL